MSTKLQDFANQSVLGGALPPQSLGSGVTNSSVIDMLSGDGRCFAIQMAGAVSGTNPTLDGKIQEGTLANGSDMADVSGATFTQVTAQNNTQAITFDRTKRYVRYVGTIGGTSTPTVLTSVFIGEQKKQL
jgi:hypothetical protein